MTLETLNKRIKTTTDLRDIVGTMKMLSSVSIGPYEKALVSLNEYGKTIWSAFIGLMKDDRFTDTMRPIHTTHPKTIAVLIGTDNGLVGRFNRDVVQFARQDLTQRGILSETHFICVGRRVGMLAETGHLKPDITYPILNSLKDVASVAGMVLVKINTLLAQNRSEQVLIYATHKKSGTPQQVRCLQLMPLPKSELKRLKHEKWEGRSLPLITANRDELFAALINEYLTVVLGGALTASLAAEHYTRMVNMQQAEKNIDDSLADMNLTYQQLRQTGITDELIDIVSGAESLKKKKEEN